MTFRVSAALSLAQLQATLTRADAGAGNARLRIYTTARPATLGAHADTPQCEIVLAKPCALVDAAGMQLVQDAPGMVLSSGLPRWAEFVAADGTVLTDGSATDAAGGGDFRLSGAETPVGETSPMFFAGGLMSIGPGRLT